MTRPVRTFAVLCAGAVVVAGLSGLSTVLLPNLRLRDPEIESVLVRTLLATLLIVVGLVTLLPRWRWWTLTAQILLSLLLGAAIAGLIVPKTFTTTGMMAATALIAVAGLSATLRATRGRWPAALSACALVGITLYVAFSPTAPASTQLLTSEQLAAIPLLTAVALGVAGFALLARAWSDSPQRSLGMPRWIGLALTVLALALSLSAWHELRTRERRALSLHSDLVEQAVAAHLKSSFANLLGEFTEFDRVSGDPAETSPSVLTQRANECLEGFPELLALEWVDDNGTQSWFETGDGFQSADGLPMPAPSTLVSTGMRQEVVGRARQSGKAAIGGPVLLNGKRSTLIAAVPPNRTGFFLALMSVERTVNAIEQGFRAHFDIEVVYKGDLLYESDNVPGASSPSKGTPVPVGAGSGVGSATGTDQLTIKLDPNANLRTQSQTGWPEMLLGALAVASALLGSTVLFAQTSAHRANLSARARSQLEQLIEGARQVAVVATDCTGLVTIFNHAAERLTGWSAASIVRSHDASCLFDPAELAEVTPSAETSGGFAALTTLANDQRAHERDWTWVRLDGGKRRINLAANPWRDGDGSLVGYLFVAVDVTEREAAMLALDKARRSADRANDLKSSFLANVSHEIRSPMTSILGSADLILDPMTTDAERREFATTIRRNGDHLLAVLNDILDISKIEAGQLRIEMLEVRLTEILDEVVQLMQIRARERSIALSIVREGSECDTLVRTDPLRIRQILVNLIGNAVKFTERGSVTVVVRAHVKDSNLIAEIDVRDTGIGMTQEEITVLFRNYGQAESSTARRFGGTGLGLAISQRLAKLLDGKIDVRSTKGEGSTFTLQLSAPIATSYVDAAAPAAAATVVTRLDDRHILLVDDSVDNQRLVATLLRRAGAAVEVVDSGRAALEAVARAGREREFDVILLDMQMPDLDGYATARELHSRGYRGRIVALTGNANEHDRDRCLAAGCDDYAIKPIARERLLAICAPRPIVAD